MDLGKLAYGVRLNLWAYTRPRIRDLYYTGGGLGDELMFTAVAAEARKRGRPIHVLTDRPEVWEGNRDVLSLQTGVPRWFWAKDLGPVPTRITHLGCEGGKHVHLAQQMARKLELDLPDSWAPVYSRRKPGEVPRGCVVIQNSCRGALYSAVTKEWAFDRWEEIARRLALEGHTLVQIGTPQDPAIPGVMDLRGKTDLPQAASILEGARLFMGLESGLMHLAAAVRVPSLIIYGGRTRPWETGYAWHWQAADISIPCAGCVLNDGCPHNVKCMNDISVEQVWLLAERALRGEKAPGFAREMRKA